MALVTVHPFAFDETIAREVSSYTDPRIEHVAAALTWGADEHVVAGLAALGWLLSRRSPNPSHRQVAKHALVCSLATAVLPHLMKGLINQERPDRLTVEGHLRGVPFSGNANDAFPSGHALHVGAAISAATLLPAKWRNAIWAAGVVLVGTRIVLLAHWTSDVVAGLAIGAGLERGLSKLTLSPRQRRGQSATR
jgi:membrane-associated phospholipid phosphatase